MDKNKHRIKILKEMNKDVNKAWNTFAEITKERDISIEEVAAAQIPLLETLALNSLLIIADQLSEAQTDD